MSVAEAARLLARDLDVDEARDVVRWRTLGGEPAETGLHDYAALYAVQGLYEAVYFLALGGRAPQLLADALAGVVPAEARATHSVLDVGAGSGAVGEHLHARGFRRVAGTDLEPASETALRRDRAEVYRDARTMDLLALRPADERWLAGLAPSVLTVAGAVGFGHLPAEAFTVLTRLLRPGGLLALTVAVDFEHAPDLAAHAALLCGPAYVRRGCQEGLHRRTADGRELHAAALVLERTGADA